MALNIKDLRIHSPAFTSLTLIPEQYTSDSKNISPPLTWSGVPAGTKQLAIICHDPDAPLPHGFTHWVIYGIPPTVNQIPEGGGSKFTEGLNSSNEPGYTGPAPPNGHGLHPYLRSHSQLLGGIIWGICMALMEQSIVDAHFGRIVNSNLAEYLVPTNADIPPIDAFLIEEEDPNVNLIGVKGIGEIGTIGSAAAICS